MGPADARRAPLRQRRDFEALRRIERAPARLNRGQTPLFRKRRSLAAFRLKLALSTAVNAEKNLSVGVNAVNERLRDCLKDARYAYPHELETRFPRLVEKIVSVWDTPEVAS